MTRSIHIQKSITEISNWSPKLDHTITIPITLIKPPTPHAIQSSTPQRHPWSDRDRDKLMLICSKSNKLLQGRGRRGEGARRPDGRKKRRSCGGSQRKRTAKRRPQRHRHGYGSRQFRKWHQRQQLRLQTQAAQAQQLTQSWMAVQPMETLALYSCCEGRLPNDLPVLLCLSFTWDKLSSACGTESGPRPWKTSEVCNETNFYWLLNIVAIHIQFLLFFSTSNYSKWDNA